MDPEYKSYQYQPSSSSGTKTTIHKGRIAVAAILALLIVGGSSYAAYSWKNQVKDLKAQKTSQSKKVKQLQKELTLLKNNKEDSSRDSSYLEITQWGVKFNQAGEKLSFKIEKKGVTEYLMLTNSTGKSIMPEYCQDLGDALYLVAISRNKTGVSTEFGQAEPYIKIADYYYFISESNGLCSNSAEKESKIKADLIRDARTIQKI